MMWFKWETCKLSQAAKFTFIFLILKYVFNKSDFLCFVCFGPVIGVELVGSGLKPYNSVIVWLNAPVLRR